jgi:hypothetical protein
MITDTQLVVTVGIIAISYVAIARKMRRWNDAMGTEQPVRARTVITAMIAVVVGLLSAMVLSVLGLVIAIVVGAFMSLYLIGIKIVVTGKRIRRRCAGG